MPTIELNLMQERELERLIDYESSTCTVGGDLVYRCAFPYRPEDDLQHELIERGALVQKKDDRHGTVVAITSDGYSYFPAKREAELELRRKSKREARLVALSALFSLIAVVAGFLLGRFL